MGKVVVWFLVSLMVICLWSLQVRCEKICPRKCSCFGSTVRCNSQKLTHLPLVSGNTTLLDLRFNNLTEIRQNAIGHLRHLHSLLLNDNQISRLRRSNFDGLIDLKKLFLHNNQIATIHEGAFDGLPNLQILYLNNNQLDNIRKGLFSNLPSLERLFLQDNRLRRLSADAFQNLSPNARLRLDRNALECNCDLVWLLERHQSGMEVSGACQSPEKMRGKSLKTMTVHDFHCSKPKIMEGPKDTEVRLGDSVRFTCHAVGDPKPQIKWMLDSNEVNADGVRRTIVENGTLVISKVTEQDAGEYECVAENEMGSVHSRPARTLITVSPVLRFLTIPQSQTVREGEDAVFRCRIEGVPEPQIEWWKNSIQIATGGRIISEDSNRILKIKKVEISDAGRYVCQGRNINGFTESSADLNVIEDVQEPPELTYEPSDRETDQGMSIEIPCRAKGSPKPVITWKKDGSSLEGRRLRVSTGGSLFLYNVTVQDSGRYECTAVNKNGQASAQALLTVRPPGSVNNAIVFQALEEATEEIDRAINHTLDSLFRADASSRVDPFRLSRFPDAIGRANARPAEIFERTLQKIRQMVRTGRVVNTTEEFLYNEILTREQVAEIERLSGCTAHRRMDDCSNMCFHQKYRTITGRCNNLQNPTWGSSYTGFRRVLKPMYENGFSQPIGWDKNRKYYGFRKPAARLVSTTLISTHEVTSDSRITHMVMQWGQFLDHDLDHALPAVSSESWDGIDCKKSCEYAPPCFPMEVPPGDPRINNRRCIDFIRTSAVCGSGETSVLWGKFTPREQLNQLTSYLDASQVYGYDDDLARDLRDFSNEYGLMREGITLPGQKPLLPYMNGQFVDCRRNVSESATNCFVTGDFRANEQVGLLAMHTIWLREHNRIARRLRRVNPHWRGEKLYQQARKIVGAQMQHITFEHWIPAVLGVTVDPYQGYNPNLDATISNVFATAALRFGHTLIQPQLERLDSSYNSIPQGPLKLRDAFFSPWRLVDEGGVDPLIRGMFATPAKLKLPEQNLNSELTEQLFRTAHAVALDLAAMNIQRGRDHAIPGYLEWREFCNMSKVSNFDDLVHEIKDPQVRQKLRELYGHPGNMDVWVGGILEDQLPGAKVGPLFKCLLLEQFTRMRDGDRFWYENNVFTSDQLKQIKETSLARILCDNADNITSIQGDVFMLSGFTNPMIDCEDIPKIDLKLWSECCEECAQEFYDDEENNDRRFRRSIRYSEEENRKARFDNLEKELEILNEELSRLKSVVADLTYVIAPNSSQISSGKIKNLNGKMTLP